MNSLVMLKIICFGRGFTTNITDIIFCKRELFNSILLLKIIYKTLVIKKINSLYNEIRLILSYN